jgi:hypothetical protein
LEAIAAGEPTQAEHWLARYQQAWQGDAKQIFAESAIWQLCNIFVPKALLLQPNSA